MEPEEHWWFLHAGASHSETARPARAEGQEIRFVLMIKDWKQPEKPRRRRIYWNKIPCFDISSNMEISTLDILVLLLARHTGNAI